MDYTELAVTYDTNEQIAILFKNQTYDERLLLAHWICDALELSDYYGMCNILGSWADEEVPEEDNGTN